MNDSQQQETILESSDSNRHARPLRYAQSVAFDAPFPLQRGGCLPELTIVYETYGKLNAAGDNAVLMCHALSGDSHVARHDESDDPGWWDLVVGPGKAIDTDRYFVVCPNLLGGCRGTTGPNSPNPATGRPYGADFPVITVADMVEAQRLLLDRLGIERLRCAVGSSLGGFMVLEWATRHPDRIAGALAMATAPRLTSQALAFDIVARNAIIRDPHFHGGQYYDRAEGPLVGLALARMLGHITYLSREAMMQKFDANRLRPHDIQTQFETKFSVGSYLAYQADRFGERFDPNSYLTLSMALDLYDLGATPEELAANLARSTCRWLLVSFTSDWLFPAFQSREMVGSLLAQDRPVSYCNVASDCGHDAFLLPDELDSYGELMRFFLANVDAPSDPSTDRCSADGCTCDTESHSLTSIFHHRHRLDYDRIVELIPPEASVLDLGCGTGGLLTRLRSRGHERLVGIELDERAIRTCVCRGLDVVQDDVNRGLPDFADGQFDFVVLSQTLQTVKDVRRVLSEMLRVGRRAIVSFPNLGYHKLRRQLADEGRAPRVFPAEGYHWYNTPNVRFVTLADFEQLCRDEGYKVLQQIALDTATGRPVDDNPNLNADVAIAVLGA